jgi:hypothetical protein
VDVFPDYRNVFARQVRMAEQHSEQTLPPCPSALHDATRKVLPAAFVILFVITGTYVLVYSLSLHQPVSPSFMTGAAITFGVLFALIFVGNFLLYARERMRLMRPTSASERSSRIGGERKAWYLRLKNVWDKWKDGPRRLIRKIALMRALKRNSRKRSVNVVNQERELSMVDLSQSCGSRCDPDLTPHRRTPVDRIDRDIDLERGEAPRDLHPTARGSIEATRMRRAAEPSTVAKNNTRTSHDTEYQRHNLAGSSRNSLVSAVVAKNSLWGTYQGAPKGRATFAEEMYFSTTQTRLTRPVLPENMLGEHALHSRARRRPGASQIPDSDKVDLQVPSEPSTEGYKSDIPTDRRPSDIGVLHLETVEQDIKYATSEALHTKQRNFNPYTTFVDFVEPSLKNGEEAGYLKFGHANKDLYRTHTSKSLPSTGSIEECGNTRSQGATDIHASDAHSTHTEFAEDRFANSPKTTCQETSTPSLSSLELAPQIPRTDHGSSASGFTSRFVESMSGIFNGDDEQHEVHSASTKQPRAVPDEKRLIK